MTGGSPLRDNVFGGDQEAYDTGLLLVTMGTGMMLDMAAQSPGVCFVAGTQVSTQRGFVPIEDVSIGDYVWAANLETGEKALKKLYRLLKSNRMNCCMYL